MRAIVKNKIAGLVALLFVASCGPIAAVNKTMPLDAKAALVNTTDVTAYSLDPEASTDANAFHGHKVLGKVKLSGQEGEDVTQDYIDALQEYQDEMKSGHSTDAKCTFQPRHALRLTGEDKHVYDYVVCFSCGLITVYKDDAEYWNGQLRGTAVKINEMLEAHHVPVAKK